jgi:DNA-nicking Smr family endonuclease
MADEKKPERPPRKLNDKLNKEDQAYWDEFTGEKQVLVDADEDFAALLDSTGDEDRPEKKEDKPDIKNDMPQVRPKVERSNNLDRRTAEKLRKGKMTIEARLDLHGMSQTQAHHALEQFILAAVRRHMRCVIVVTGKGKSKATSEEWLYGGQGILKQKVPGWLSSGIFKEHVLQAVPAQPKDGGSGALYVYLRRQR